MDDPVVEQLRMDGPVDEQQLGVCLG